jgi:peptide/nickel transport system permease protein
LASRLARFLIVRLALTLPTVFILLSFVFVITRLLPGNPAVALSGGRGISEAAIQAIEARYGLNLPLSTQYVNYFRMVFTGNWGIVITGDRTVQSTIWGALPNTVELTVAGIFLGALIGIVLGVISSQRRSKKTAGLAYFATQIGISLPIFWIALLLQLFFGIYLRVLPVTGLIGSSIPARITGIYPLDALITGNIPALEDSTLHLILPAFSIALIYLGPTAALIRANFRRVSNEDYITAQRATGLPQLRIDYVYTLKNTLIPVVTLIGLQFAGLITGAVLVENVYSIQGLGSLLVTAVTERDYFLIQGTMVYIGLIVAVTSVIADVIYALVDPRVKY